MRVRVYLQCKRRGSEEGVFTEKAPKKLYKNRKRLNCNK